jgi:serine/threonine protein kinase
MSLLQTSPEHNQTDNLRCKRCHAVLPAHATFCGVCGARVEKHIEHMSTQDNAAVSEQYRIISLIRRRPHTQLYFAIDHHSQRPVIIREIDISGLQEKKRKSAIAAAHDEYDLLRQQRIPDITPVIDTRHFQEHLFLVTGWPFSIYEQSTSTSTLPGSTLHDFLQSGIGLPNEDTAVTWMYRLCSALERLHQQQIVPGDLDPQSILVSEEGYDGMPALAISWLPAAIQELLQPASVATDAHSFVAPEARKGTIEPRSDIYSLGAILYLLLTGTPPATPTSAQQRLRSPRELNANISTGVEEVTMRALATKSEERFQTSREMSDALLHLCDSTRPVRLSNRSTKRKSGRHSQRLYNRAQVHSPTRETGAIISKPTTGQDDVTVAFVPIKTQSTIQTEQIDKPDKQEKPDQSSATETTRDTPAKNREPASRFMGFPTIPLALDKGQFATSPIAPEQTEAVQEKRNLIVRLPSPVVQQIKEHITAVVPVLPRLLQPVTNWYLTTVQPKLDDDAELTIIKRVHRFLVGELHQDTTAATIIETPMRLQPNQNYVIRIHIMGRDEPVLALTSDDDPDTAIPAGVSGLIKGDIVHLEVRSAIYQSHAYIVQLADIQVPGTGYASEVRLPMRALAPGRGGRRERLHIFFMDRLKRPLYEKPFVIEFFVSPHVQVGQEGHNILTIPL